jgi:HEAT repeat protein
MEPARIDEMIASEDSSLRREAATLLAEIGGDEASERLGELLKDHNNGVRDAAQNSIVMLGGRTFVEKMIPLLIFEDPAIRNMAIDILRKIGIDGIDILHASAKDSNDNVRLFVLDILGTIGSHESLDTLIEGLYDTNPNVRNASVISLGELGEPQAFEHLGKLINDEEWIRFSVIESLARIPHEGAVGFLLEELGRRSNDEITVCAILETLGKIGSKDSIRPLIDMLEKSGEYVEASVAQTLLNIMSVEDIEALDPKDGDLLKGILERYLPDAEDEFLHNILSVMGSIGDTGSAARIMELARKVDPDHDQEKWEDIKGALIELGNASLMVSLLDDDEKSRILSSEILGKIGGEKEGGEISKRIFSQEGYVKRAMTDTLANIGGPGSRKTLLRLIHDQDGHVVTSSLQALGEIGNPDDIDEVREFLRHPYPDVRGTALEAIARIGTDKAEECFTSLAKDSDPKIRIMAIGGLDRIMSACLPDTAAYMLKDQDWEVRMAAVKITRDAMLPIENDLLVALLNDEHDEIRHLAIGIVGQRKIGGLRSFLEDAISNDEMWTSYHAIESLGQFKDEDAKTRLLTILRSGPDFLRISALRALGLWEDESLAPDLEVYMDDDNLDVARAAAEAMDKLQGVAF